MALLAIKADKTQLEPCPSLSFNGADFHCDSPRRRLLFRTRTIRTSNKALLTNTHG
jgi:hypothetical protein